VSAPLVEQIANAVLYEGYLLYPYRASAVKNRQRWNFGVVAPQESMETQCLALGGSLTALSVKVRCLRLVERVGESWQEAAECEMTLPDVRFAELEAGVMRRVFAHPATRTEQRSQEALECTIEVSAEQVQDGLFRIGVRISNTTPIPATSPAQALLSAHTILRVRGGEFVSLLETPAEFQEAATACRNVGTWPVLVGEEGARDTVLSSPIILYDYPQVAPESPGDLFDGAEIDEILSLRILTLTDDEKDAMRHTDDRARRILERTEALPPEHFMKLHGVLRSLRPAGKESS
jgi:hydrogenase maturation protease